MKEILNAFSSVDFDNSSVTAGENVKIIGGHDADEPAIEHGNNSSVSISNSTISSGKNTTIVGGGSSNKHN